MSPKTMNCECLVKMTCPSTLENGHVPRITLKKTTGLILSLLSTRSFTNESFFRSHPLRFRFSVATYWLLATHFASAANQADISSRNRAS